MCCGPESLATGFLNIDLKGSCCEGFLKEDVKGWDFWEVVKTGDFHGGMGTNIWFGFLKISREISNSIPLKIHALN